MCTSLLINTDHTRKSFTILADDEYYGSMSDRFDSKNANLPVIANKIKSVYHQNCVIPNEDFSILYNSIASKVQPPPSYTTLPSKVLYSPSKEFFNKVSSKLRDLRPSKSDHQHEELSKDTNMERPMFITTVKSGTFLEPPPEVAALLGLRKNSFSNTNSSNSSTAKTHNNDQNMVYSFASKPRILKSTLHTNFASRSLFRVENRREKRETLNEPLPKIINDTSDGGAPSYGNTMFDRRVARGSNFAAQRPNVISTEHVLSRQAEARRRAAVRQRAQIRARKLRLGTPPPIDGRRHGQIQTDKFLEELTERPPDKSIACQADLPVQYHSPVHSLDSNRTTGVEAETQIYPGDLPDIDDELPSVVSSIVNKILQEAILEINDEIEVIRLRTLASEQKRVAANTSTSDETGVITKAQLQMLIVQAINELKQSDSNDRNYDDVNGKQLLEKIFDEIKNMVTDVKFLTGIIKTQLENWPEDSNQNNEAEPNRAENEQTDEENNVSDNETIDLGREPLSAATDNGFQQDAEIDDYKTDDFEEESKDLVDDENEPGDRRDSLDSDRNAGPRDDSETAEVADGPNGRSDSAQAADGNTRSDTETEITANENITEVESADVGEGSEANQNTDSEVVSSNQETPNDSQSQMNNRQNNLIREPPPVIITEPHKESADSAEPQSSREIDDSSRENEESKPNDERTVESTNDNSQNDAPTEPNQNDTNDQPLETNDNVDQSSENSSSNNQSTVTIPTMKASLLDPPVNDSNPEDDVIVKDAFENQPTQGPSEGNQPSENKATLTIPAMNMSLLDPPVNDMENGNQNPNDGLAKENSSEDQNNSSDRDQDIASGNKIESNESNSNSSDEQTPQSEQNSVNNNDVDNSDNNIINNEQTSSSTEEQATGNPNNDPIPKIDNASGSVDEQSSSNVQNVTNNESSAPNDVQVSNSNEEQGTPRSTAPADPSTEPETSTGESSQQPAATTRHSASEDDNDVVAVQATTTESSAPNPDITSTKNRASSDTSASPDDPADTSNTETTADNSSERDSSATTKAESAQDKPSDTESVENNELQSNTSPSEDSNNSAVNSQNPSNDDGSSQQSDKPLNTQGATSAPDGQSEGTIEETNRPESRLEQNSETVLDNSTADSTSKSEPPSETTSQNDTQADDVNSNQPPSEPLVNGNSTTESDTEPSTQTDVDARNNNELDKSAETNNNDSTIRSKNPTTIVQNGNIITNS